jgi:hypothetical protein
MNKIMKLQDQDYLFRLEGPNKVNLLENNSKEYYNLTMLDPITLLQCKDTIEVDTVSFNIAIEKGAIIECVVENIDK